jgi:hypothetical protein
MAGRGATLPRLRIQTADASSASVPPELLDADDPTWKSIASTRIWLKHHQIDIGQSIEYGPINRRRSAAVRWAFDMGITRPPMANGFVGLDGVRARETGLLLDGYGDAVREQFRFSGVQFISEDLPGERKV